VIDWCKPLLRRCSALPTWMNGSLMWRPGDLWGAFRQSYEPEVARHMESVLATCDGMVDIGAHQGNWTVWAARRFPKLKIVAVEPGRVRESLVQMLRLNGVTSRVQVVDACVSGHRDTVTYFDTGLMTAAISRQQAEAHCPPDQRGAIAELTVDAVTLDDVVDMARRFCQGDRLLVKCDIEGHETDVFADCPALNDDRLSFVVELHNVSSPEDSIVVANARAAGREVSTVGQFWRGTATVAF
jgi:FkbM family methyltransferase